MTQAELDFSAPCRETIADRMAAYFRRHEGRWIDVTELAAVGGIGGWRSRVAELRFPPYGMDVQWRLQRWPDGRNRSQYRYVPASVRAGQGTAA
jgi:hypothetical protein